MNSHDQRIHRKDSQMSKPTHIVLTPTSKPPRPTVDAYLERPALGGVTIDQSLKVQSPDPEQLIALGVAFYRAGKSLEHQIALDSTVGSQLRQVSVAS